MTTTQQVGKEAPNPSGKGGFADHPENRNPGGWNKDFTFSYQYKRFMNMSVEDLERWKKIPDKERKVVEQLAYKRVMAAKESLPDVKEITDRTEGKSRESLDVTTNGESLNDVKKLTDSELDERIRLILNRENRTS